jgi:hypothetical protein
MLRLVGYTTISLLHLMPYLRRRLYCKFILTVGHFEVLCPLRLQEHTLSRKLRTKGLQVVSYPIFLNPNIAVIVHISMEQKLFRGTNSCSASQKVSQIYTTLRLLTVFAVLESSSYTEPTESSLHSHTWLSELIPKSKIDGTIHFSCFPVPLILVAYNKTPSFNSCIFVSLRNF